MASSIKAQAVATYVGQKVSAVRWRPTFKSIEESTGFVSGGWDDEPNKVCFWTIEHEEERFLRDFATSIVPTESKLAASAPVADGGNVTDIQFLDPDRFLAALSTGTVQLWSQRDSMGEISLVEEYRWSDLHRHRRGSASCTCLAVNHEVNSLDVVTGGEDGRILVLRPGASGPIQEIQETESTAINGISFTKATEVVTVGMAGQLKLWDFREDSRRRASKIMHMLLEPSALLCVDCHPDQWHLVAAGNQDGVLSIWDLRQEKYPVSLMESHSANVWEVKFHRHYPNNLFSCSDDGSVLHWDASAVTPVRSSDESSIYSPWLADNASSSSSDIQVSHMLPHHKLPVHSLDILSRHLVCGSDSEAVVVVYNLTMR
ncbi:nucleoporin Nup43-like [Oscarella lobularis]|uniref:nucleoporin Nup43-like n=1 Tax=Oscarella lobularis TaxID=121494 RepID=UPI0033138F12